MRRWAVTFFGLGLSPVAPGTLGSLGATVLLWFIYRAMGAPAFAIWELILSACLFASSALAIMLAPWAIQHFGKKDPQPFVLDEVAGICLTNLMLPIRNGHDVLTFGLAFIAFRLFDITKPPPARQLEHLPGGWGILLDDLAAGVYANVLCQLLLRLVLRVNG